MGCWLFIRTITWHKGANMGNGWVGSHLYSLFSLSFATPIANPWFGPDPLFLLSGPKEGIKHDFKIKSKWYIWNPIFHPRNIGFGMCLVERAASWDGPTLRRDLWHSSTCYFHVFKSSYSFGGLILSKSLLHLGLSWNHQSFPFGPSLSLSIPAFTTFWILEDGWGNQPLYFFSGRAEHLACVSLLPLKGLLCYFPNPDHFLWLGKCTRGFFKLLLG